MPKSISHNRIVEDLLKTKEGRLVFLAQAAQRGDKEFIIALKVVGVFLNKSQEVNKTELRTSKKRWRKHREKT